MLYTILILSCRFAKSKDKNIMKANSMKNLITGVVFFLLTEAEKDTL